MRPDDLLRISSTNLDHLTETYNIGFYLEYLTRWPELCQIIEGMDGQIEGYSTFYELQHVYEYELTKKSNSPRQTRIVTFRTPNKPLQALNHGCRIPQLPSMARPHHRPDCRPQCPTPWPRNCPLVCARALL